MDEIYGVQDGACAKDSTMIRVIRICRKCGAKIFSDAPEALCARCVLKSALGDFAGAPVAAGDDGGSSENTEANVAAPQSKKAARAAELLGELGDYELLEEVGRGGQGVVFRARQKSLNRTVALKVIGVGQWASKAHLKRFRREAEAAASLEHPGIVPIHEVGERDGSCYFSMKFIEGGQLDEIVRREPMPIRQAAEFIAKVARIVHYAHEHGILHRDIKPGNILLDAKGEPNLTDFGLARLLETESTVTRTREVLGTPSYMAPEQALGQNAAVGSATDVYGLGAVLYQLLTGHPPFAGGTTYETIKLLLDTEPRQPRLWNPKIDRDLSTICSKCLEKDPKRRYSSALMLAEDLERWLKHEPILARHTGIFVRGKKWVRRNPTSALLAASLIALAATAGWIIWKSELVRHPVTTGIAVLPFENLSERKENASFADGVQDDILTKLAKIGDLKVISRTSVMDYRGKRNVRQIGDVLRVSHVLEGSARRSGDRIHLNAQLIDTRTDTHIWAEEYDRDLNDLFAIQAEIAQKVAERLHAKITAAEKLAIEQPPTTDPAAFDLYSRAKSLLLTVGFSGTPEPDLRKAIELLDEAVKRDPSFFDAYCELAYAHEYFYGVSGYDHTPARLALAEAAAQAATRLRPDAAETHLARAQYLYFGLRDYAGALAQLEIARRALPNDPRLFELTGYILRRRGQQEEGLQNLQRAAELDPRNIYTLHQIANSCQGLGRYAESIAALDRVLAIVPDNVEMRANRGLFYLFWKADTRPLRQTIDAILAQGPGAIASGADIWFDCALAESDPAAAERALALGDNPCWSDAGIKLSHGFGEGLLARMTKDEASARTAFEAARAQQEKIVQAQPDYGPALCVLAMIDAGLGHKELALEEGRRAIALTPVEKDVVSGSRVLQYFAITAAWAGDKELALQQLEAGLRAPVASQMLSYGALKLLPVWDPLRGDPRFEKIVASLAPK
jgi:serine/threonine protein kinase/TolB-like protein/Tfp pilus assembly protein PilF